MITVMAMTFRNMPDLTGLTCLIKSLAHALLVFDNSHLYALHCHFVMIVVHTSAIPQRQHCLRKAVSILSVQVYAHAMSLHVHSRCIRNQPALHPIPSDTQVLYVDCCRPYRVPLPNWAVTLMLVPAGGLLLPFLLYP